MNVRCESPRNYPQMYVETRCDDCGTLIVAERVRPIMLERWAAIMEHHRKQILSHVETCHTQRP